MSQRPVAIGLLLCEQLIVEKGTKNVTPVNCFTQRTAPAFPWTSPSFAVVVWLTNGQGEVALEVVVEDADTLEELPVVLVRLNSLVFPKPGTFRVTLLADGEIIAQRKLFVVLKEDSHE
jgi:hypothetical protein